MVGYWNKQSLKLTTLKTFACTKCGLEEEALPTGIEDVMGGTHYVYTTPLGWWSITTRGGMLLFCRDEAVTIIGGEVFD